jgi:hypothetical protein
MSNAIARRTFLTTAAAATAAGAFGAPSRAQHRTIEVGDVALECTFSGLGIPVVLLANAGCSVGYFDYLAGMLATRGFQAVSINIRGVAVAALSTTAQPCTIWPVTLRASSRQSALVQRT